MMRIRERSERGDHDFSKDTGYPLSFFHGFFYGSGIGRISDISVHHRFVTGER